MKKRLFISILLLPILCLLFMGFAMSRYDYPLPREEQLVNYILATTAKIVGKKYQMIPVGSGAAMPEGPIRELLLRFRTKRPYSKEQLRKLLLQLTQELVNQVNENKEIQQYLADPPFSTKNVDISIFNSDESGREVYDPGISTISIVRKVVYYRTTDAADPLIYKNRFEETYEEALKSISSSSEDVK